MISGTSVDGIDAALVDISGTTSNLQVRLITGATYPYPPLLREQILAVAGGAALPIAELAALDDAIALEFAQAAIAIQIGHPAADVIGSHGQTVYHRPAGNRDGVSPNLSLGNSLPLGYSLQLGRGDAIAHLTGTTTISNFRVADIAAGGQGAPLVSAVDVCLLRHQTFDRCIQTLAALAMSPTFLPLQLTAPSRRTKSSVGTLAQAIRCSTWRYSSSRRVLNPMTKTEIGQRRANPVCHWSIAGSSKTFFNSHRPSPQGANTLDRIIFSNACKTQRFIR